MARMFPEPEFAANEPGPWHRVGQAGMGALRVTLLFGSAAIALALIIAPIAERETRTVIARANAPFGLDSTPIGSIHRSQSYTIRRSILQPTPNSVCIISSSGRRSGAC
jgi:hypothetical protein